MSPQRHRLSLGAKLLLLFTIVPLVEFCLLIWLWHMTSFLFTLCLVLCSGILGAAMARHQGLAVWRQSQRELSMGRFPADPLVDGLIILVGGALLVTPGLVTDIAGFSTLFPPARRLFRQWVKRSLRGRFVLRSGMRGGAAGGFNIFTQGMRTPGAEQAEEKVRVVTEDEPPAGSPFEEKSPFDRQ